MLDRLTFRPTCWRRSCWDNSSIMSARLVRLPMFYDITKAEASDVVREIYEFYGVVVPS